MPDALINDIEKDLRLNLYKFIDIQNEGSPEEIFHAFDQFYYRFGRFPSSNNVLVVPTGDIPYLLKQMKNYKTFQMGSDLVRISLRSIFSSFNYLSSW